MTVPTSEEIALALDRTQGSEIDAALGRFFQEHGLEALIPPFIAAFPAIRAWQGRNAILFWLRSCARKHPEVVELAMRALNDRAYLVRMQAMSILAYSLRQDAVPLLELQLDHRNQETRADAAAAIDAIRNQNHHYWLDREHTGKAFWVVSREDEP